MIEKDCNNCIHFGEDDDLPEDRCFQCIRSDNIDEFWEEDTFVTPNQKKS